jgi:hypothetical protein
MHHLIVTSLVETPKLQGGGPPVNNAIADRESALTPTSGTSTVAGDATSSI